MNIIAYAANCTDCGTGKYSTTLGAGTGTTCTSCSEGKFSAKSRAGEVFLVFHLQRRIFP